MSQLTRLRQSGMQAAARRADSLSRLHLPSTSCFLVTIQHVWCMLVSISAQVTSRYGCSSSHYARADGRQRAQLRNCIVDVPKRAQALLLAPCCLSLGANFEPDS